MIYSIKGIVKKLTPNKTVVETSIGVSIEILISPALSNKLELGKTSVILVALIVTEKFLGFYGFIDEKERDIFYKLEAISGIGHRLAYKIVTFSTLEELKKRVQVGDVGFFIQIPGIGKKTAQKLIVDLSQIFEEDISVNKLFLDEKDKLLLEILKNLGFKVVEIKKILSKVDKSKPIEDRVKIALRYLSKN